MQKQLAIAKVSVWAWLEVMNTGDEGCLCQTCRRIRGFSGQRDEGEKDYSEESGLCTWIYRGALQQMDNAREPNLRIRQIPIY